MAGIRRDVQATCCLAGRTIRHSARIRGQFREAWRREMSDEKSSKMGARSGFCVRRSDVHVVPDGPSPRAEGLCPARPRLPRSLLGPPSGGTWCACSSPRSAGGCGAPRSPRQGSGRASERVSFPEVRTPRGDALGHGLVVQVRRVLSTQAERNNLSPARDSPLAGHPLPPFAVLESYLAPGGGLLTVDSEGMHYTGITLRRKEEWPEMPGPAPAWARQRKGSRCAAR